MGSSPIRVAKIEWYADLAHLVERHLAKVEVASSSLVIRSKALAKAGAMFLLLQKCSRSAKVKTTVP